MPWNTVEDYSFSGWSDASQAANRARYYCEQLEQGEILFFREFPFKFSTSEREFLQGNRGADSGVWNSRIHKNISYRPGEDLLRGFSGRDEDVNRMRQIMRNYSSAVTRFVEKFLSPYAPHWSLDFASFRPSEEQGRDLPLHKRNDLLHVDAFPSRPTRGGRILRVFSNINSQKPRIWLVTDRFEAIARKLAADAGLESIAEDSGSGWGSFRRKIKERMRAMNLPVADRSLYDEFMLHFHDYLKENSDFQQHTPKERLEFPPLSTWMVFTDMVPHAVMSGQFALEQTYIVDRNALLAPQNAPINILEELSGKTLA